MASRARAAIDALRHVGNLQRRVEALEAENRQLREQVTEAIEIAHAARDNTRTFFLEIEQRLDTLAGHG